MDRRSTRAYKRFDACCPSPDIVIFHQLGLEVDAHALPLLQRHGMRPREKVGAVDSFGCSRSVGKADAFRQLRVEPNSDSMTGPAALTGPLQLASNIGAFDG